MDRQERAAEAEIDWARFKTDQAYRVSVERREQGKIDEERLRFRVAVEVAVRLYRSGLKM
jgi:hypothetical protein